MENNLLACQVKLTKPIESNTLTYFERSELSTNSKLLIYNLTSRTFSNHRFAASKSWIFNIPKFDTLLILEKNRGGRFALLFTFMNNPSYKTSIVSSEINIDEITYCDGYIYILGYISQRCRIFDHLGNLKKHFRWVKIPKLDHQNAHKYFSCVKYYDKMLITEVCWNSLYFYDEMVNSYSTLPVVLKTGYKILAVHELKIYVITFSGPIYVNKGDLVDWSIASLNFFDFDQLVMASSIYYRNNFYISNNKNFYKFWFDKEKLEKIQF